MNEQAPQTEEYQINPNDLSPDGRNRRVADEDKAHTLALAGDRLESASAELRKEMVATLGQTAYEGGYQTHEVGQAEKAVKTIEDNNFTVDTIYNQHSQAYDKLQATKR